MATWRRIGSVAALGLALLSLAPSAGAQDVGHAAVSPAEGGSSTELSIRLPGRAECPGDSADDGYRVNSYMVPAAVDPSAITFNGLGPTPPAFGRYETFREPLFDLETNSYVSAQTADAELPGQPGPIVNIPTFSFAVYQPGDVPAGTYHIGLACTLLNEITTIWDAEIVVTEASDDEPAGFRWRLVDPPTKDASSSAVPVVAATAAAAAVIATLVRRRRTPRSLAPHSEDT